MLPSHQWNAVDDIVTSFNSLAAKQLKIMHPTGWK